MTADVVEVGTAKVNEKTLYHCMHSNKAGLKWLFESTGKIQPCLKFAPWHIPYLPRLTESSKAFRIRQGL
jgi:hypothetical protein